MKSSPKSFMAIHHCKQPFLLVILERSRVPQKMATCPRLLEWIHYPIRLSCLYSIGTTQMLAVNRGWRIIERGGELRATELRKSVRRVLMADSESGG